MFRSFTIAFVLSLPCTTALKANPDSPVVLARLVADRVLKDYPAPPPFDWGEGVLMTGMMRAGQVLHEPRYIDFVRAWADHWQKYGIEQVLAGGPERGQRGYCGRWGPGYAVMLLYEQEGGRKYAEMARSIADYILHKATRTKERGLGHWGGNYQLWVDTLYMQGPLLAALYRADPRLEYMRDVDVQLDIYARHLRDPRTGLYYHMYDEPKKTRSSELWARGNAWVAMTLIETLPAMPAFDEKTERFKREFRQMMESLRGFQDEKTGLWHTVLDHPETYNETSASALFAAAFKLGHKRGLLSSRDRGRDEERVSRAWQGLTGRVDDWGWVFGVSGGTRPGTLAEYANKATGTYTWGTGAVLILAAASME